MIDCLTMGGAQQLLLTFAGEAVQRGCRMAVISLAEDDGSPYSQRLHALGVKVYYFPTKRIFDFNNLYKIAKLFRAEKPDILHTHLTYSNIVGSIVARITGIPVVSTIHSTNVDPQFHAPRTERVEVFVLRHLVHTVIACGPAVEKYCRNLIKDEPFLVISNAVNYSAPEFSSSERENMRREISGDGNRPLLISVGRLAIQKGFGDLIDAFLIFHSFRPSAFLAIVGNGELYAELEEKIKELDLSDDVRLLGSRADVPSLLSISDMYVLASRWEGLPIAIMEAMAAGLPVLTTDVGDNAWVLDSTGVIVPPQQPEAFARAMLELFDDPTRRQLLGQAARVRVEKNFTPYVWFDKLISVYQSLLK